MREFQEQLERQINETYAERRQHLADGVCMAHVEPSRIATEYARNVGYLDALRHVRDLCREITRKMNGDPSEVQPTE